MPLFSSFAPFGMMTFSSQPTYAQRIYVTLRASQGNDDGAFREFGYQGAKLYATSMFLGRVQECYSRITEQHSPKTVTFLLPEKEFEYGITPDDSLTDSQRRAALSTRYISGAGSTETELDSGLSQILGSNLIDLVLPSDPIFATLISQFSTTPPIYSNFKNSTIPGKWFIAQNNWGPESGKLIGKLICGDPPIVDELFVFGSHNESTTQALIATEITHLGNDLYEFDFAPGVTHAVEEGQGFTTNSYPVWSTGRRRFLIKITEASSKDGNLMSNVNNYMERSIKAVSVWEKSIPQVGGFVLNVSSLNYTLFNLWHTLLELELREVGHLLPRWMMWKWKRLTPNLTRL
jgi:hypothetical protein